jgi:hypothetical protein
LIYAITVLVAIVVIFLIISDWALETWRNRW